MTELLKKIPRRKSQVHPDLKSDQSVPITTTEVKFPTNVPQDNTLIAEGCRRASLGQYKEAINSFRNSRGTRRLQSIIETYTSAL